MTRIQISAFLSLSVIYWVIALYVQGVPLTKELLVPFGSVVGAVSLSLLLFDKWAWKFWPLNGFLIKRPLLHGTWRTELQSDWVDPSTNQVIPPINCYMVIRQTASTLSIRLVTRESRSETVSAAIEDCGDGTFEVNCAYRNKPRAMYRHRSDVHFGAMLLMADCLRPPMLEGDYWTDRKTIGTINLRDRKKKTCLNFEEAEDLFEAS
jgi:SMODS-associating 2TM, beta-strand rich effector domain